MTEGLCWQTTLFNEKCNPVGPHAHVMLLSTNLGVRGSNPFGRANLFNELEAI